MSRDSFRLDTCIYPMINKDELVDCHYVASLETSVDFIVTFMVCRISHATCVIWVGSIYYLLIYINLSISSISPATLTFSTCVNNDYYFC